MPKIKIEGYQPKKGNNLDITNPPRGGSGLDQLSLTDEKDAHIFECHEMIRALKKAYRLAHNSAVGLTNYCEESASTRRCERELEQAEMIYNQSLETSGQKDDCH